MALLFDSRHFSGTNYIDLQPDKLCIVVSVILNSTLYIELCVRMIMTDQSDRKSVMTCMKYYPDSPWEKTPKE
jgi:hypothetical protein